MVTQVWVEPGSQAGMPPHVVGGTQAFWEEVVIREVAEWLYSAVLSKTSQLPEDIPGIVAIDISEDLAGASDMGEIVAGLASVSICRHVDIGASGSGRSQEWPGNLHAVFLFTGSMYGEQGLRRGCFINPASEWVVDTVGRCLAGLVNRWCGQ